MLLAAVLLGIACLPHATLAQTQGLPRPADTYLHRPFVRINIAVSVALRVNGRVVSQIRHLAVRDRAAITRLVHAINRARTVPLVYPPCSGGGFSPFPTAFWLSFVRVDGVRQHAVYYDPCCGYYIRGVRLGDPGGEIWRVLLALVGGRG